MTVSPDYLSYPRRRAGMDHERYPYSNVFKRRAVEWPNAARVALWVLPTLELFPLDMTASPFRPPGGMERSYPDYWNYTLRDYGNRVGVFRIFEALDRLAMPATVAMSSRLADRAPFLLNEVTRRGWELMAHGVDMGRLHHAGLDEAEERQLVRQSFETLRQCSGREVSGWSSPAYQESWCTPDLVAEAGARYFADWVNDDLPYEFSTAAGKLVAMPLGYEISDLRLFHEYRQRPDQYVEQVMSHFRLLYREAERCGGRVVALPLRPWISGVPHRIGAVETVLERILGHAGVWPATATQILEAWQQQQR